MITISFLGRLLHYQTRCLVAVMLIVLACCRPAFSSDFHEAVNAVSNGDLKKVKALLNEDPNLAFVKDDEGNTLLLFAASNGYVDLAKLLLSYRADINSKTFYGSTPLHEAVWEGRKAMVELLLAHGADVNVKCKNCKPSPLYYAVFHRNKALAELLLAHGADVDASNPIGVTSLGLAAELNDKAMVELLLTYGADVNAQDRYGVMPLHGAMADGHEDVAKILRQHGGREYGYSPMALQWGVDFLLILAATLFILFLIIRKLKRMYAKHYYRYAISFLTAAATFVFINIFYFPRMAIEDLYRTYHYGGPFAFYWETEGGYGIEWNGLLFDIALVLLVSGLMAVIWNVIATRISKNPLTAYTGITFRKILDSREQKNPIRRDRDTH
jgi:hypothetical protein